MFVEQAKAILIQIILSLSSLSMMDFARGGVVLVALTLTFYLLTPARRSEYDEDDQIEKFPRFERPSQLHEFVMSDKQHSQIRPSEYSDFGVTLDKTHSPEEYMLPVRTKTSMLDPKDRELFKILSEIGYGEFLVFINVPLSRIVTVTDVTVSIGFEKRLRSQGVHFLLVEHRSLKPLLGISHIAESATKSPVFIRDVLKSAHVGHLVLDKGSEYDRSSLEPLLRAKMLPSGARIQSKAVGF